jgi:beta-lactamase class A
MKNLFPCLIFFVLGIGSVVLYQTIKQSYAANEPFAATNPCKFQFLNPLRCEPATARKKKEYVLLRNELMEYIDQQTKDGKLTSAGVYFRDLQNGPTLSINSQEDFIPASLLKLPLMMTYYKKAEEVPRLLSRRITVAGNVSTLEQDILPGKSAEIGKDYTIDDLIGLLITESDNISWKVLLNDLRKNYSEEDFVATLSDMGIVDPRKRTDQQYITVQSYASIFRILYNGSYLNLDMSEKALMVLSETTYKNGLLAGVPTGTKVAHKFGEQKNGDEQQLHDCGIVYFEPDPYIICVMTRGHTIQDLEPVIQEISRKVYTEVANRN